MLEINDAIAKIAAKYGATLIDFYGTELSGTQYSTYAFDRIHPKKAGMDKIFETIYYSLRK